MRIVIAVLTAAFLLTACVNSYKQNYHPYVDTQSTPNLELLPEGAKPTLYKSANVKQDVENAKAKGYIVVGEASFNGQLESDDNIVTQAQAVKATMVIYSSTYTDTQTVTSTMYQPSTTTTVSSGKINRRGGGGADYKEVSTSTTTVPIPVTEQVRNFDQNAVFLVKPVK